jgi:hypothetical protein
MAIPGGFFDQLGAFRFVSFVDGVISSWDISAFIEARVCPSRVCGMGGALRSSDILRDPTARREYIAKRKWRNSSSER